MNFTSFKMVASIHHWMSEGSMVTGCLLSTKKLQFLFAVLFFVLRIQARIPNKIHFQSKFKHLNFLNSRKVAFLFSSITLQCKIHLCLLESCVEAATTDDCEKLSTGNFKA